jgi:type IV secretory pathway VirD2 relaxase
MMSDLLRNDLEMKPRPLRRRGERQHTRKLWWTAALLGSRRSRGVRISRFARRGADVRFNTRSYLQRSAIKVSYSRNTKSASWAAHGRYLAREGAQQKGVKGFGFDAGRDDLDLARMAKAWQEAGDQHMFRIIVSPENGTEIDLREHAHMLMAQMERDLGTRLEWAAIDHHNTDNPHVHILLRGRDETGLPLRIDPDYIKSGIRERSAEIASRELGLRTERDILHARGRAVERIQFTEIDRTLIRCANDSGLLAFEGKQPRGAAQKARRAQDIARLAFLERFGLAFKVDSLLWGLSPDLQKNLRQQQLATDIIKSRARHNDQILDQRAPIRLTRIEGGQQITGRVVGTGLENEGTDRRYILLEGTDGRLHYIRQTAAMTRARGEDRLRVGETVTLSGGEFEKNGKRLYYVRIQDHNKGRTR